MDIACWKHASKQSTPAPFNWRQSLTKYPSLDPPPFMMEHEYRPLWTSRTSSPGRNWVPRYTAYTWWISLSSEAQRKTLSPPLGYGDGSQTWGWWIAATTPGGSPFDPTWVLQVCNVISAYMDEDAWHLADVYLFELDATSLLYQRFPQVKLNRRTRDHGVLAQWIQKNQPPTTAWSKPKQCHSNNPSVWISSIILCATWRLSESENSR